MNGRYEHKYVVPVRQYKVFMKWIDPYLMPDRFNQGRRSPIVSQYFDTSSLDFFRDKVEGEKFRQKLRLRWYPTNGQEVREAYLEIKKKYNNTISKSRYRMNWEQAAEFLKDSDVVFDSLPEEYQFLLKRHRMIPSALVSYFRESWIAIGPTTLRLTFDFNVRAGHFVSGEEIRQERGECQVLSPSLMVFEVKTFDEYPTWLQRAIQHMRWQQVSYSKYCEGVMPLYPWHGCVKLIPESD